MGNEEKGFGLPGGKASPSFSPLEKVSLAPIPLLLLSLFVLQCSASKSLSEGDLRVATGYMSLPLSQGSLYTPVSS